MNPIERFFTDGTEFEWTDPSFSDEFMRQFVTFSPEAIFRPRPHESIENLEVAELFDSTIPQPYPSHQHEVQDIPWSAHAFAFGFDEVDVLTQRLPLQPQYVIPAPLTDNIIDRNPTSAEGDESHRPLLEEDAGHQASGPPLSSILREATTGTKRRTTKKVALRGDKPIDVTKPSTSRKPRDTTLSTDQNNDSTHEDTARAADRRERKRERDRKYRARKKAEAEAEKIRKGKSDLQRRGRRGPKKSSSLQPTTMVTTDQGSHPLSNSEISVLQDLLSSGLQAHVLFDTNPRERDVGLISNDHLVYVDLQGRLQQGPDNTLPGGYAWVDLIPRINDETAEGPGPSDQLDQPEGGSSCFIYPDPEEHQITYAADWTHVPRQEQVEEPIQEEREESPVPKLVRRGARMRKPRAFFG